MGVHNNVAIPSESWPGWTWYAIEFGIVLAVSMLIASQASDAMLPSVAAGAGHADALESWEDITIYSPEFAALDDAIESKITGMSNWVFYGIFGAIFAAWYGAIRKPVLRRISLI